MHVFEYDPILAGVPYAPFQLVGLGVGLEVENIAAILLRVENTNDGSVTKGRLSLFDFVFRQTGICFFIHSLLRRIRNEFRWFCNK